MALYTIGSYGSSMANMQRGQSFTPNVAGGGTGVPESVTTIYLESVTFAYSSSNTSERASIVYLYDAKPSLQDLSNNGAQSKAGSTSLSDGSVFGAGTYTRTFTFSPRVQISLSTKYFLLFASSQLLRVAANSPYSGGESFNGSLGATTNDAHFEVTVSDM